MTWISLFVYPNSIFYLTANYLCNPIIWLHSTALSFLLMWTTNADKMLIVWMWVLNFFFFKQRPLYITSCMAQISSVNPSYLSQEDVKSSWQSWVFSCTWNCLFPQLLLPHSHMGTLCSRDATLVTAFQEKFSHPWLLYVLFVLPRKFSLQLPA